MTVIETIDEETQALVRQDKENRIAEAQVLDMERPTQSLAADPYVGVSAVPFDERAQTVLSKYQDVPHEWLDVKPDGKLYLSHIKARNILNEAFGFGGWALVPVGEYHIERTPFKDKYGKDAEHVVVYRTYRLYVNGRYHDEATGAGNYYTNNRDADYSDACEAAKSFALNRLCKTFNIAQRCWDKAYGEWWKKTYAYQDDRGNWKKTIGSGSPQDGRGNTDTERPREHPPEVPTHSSPVPDPEPSSKKNLTAIIQVATPGKGWMYGSTPCQMFKDTEGKSWKFVGETIKTAKDSGGAPLAIEYVKEQTSKGVVSAVVSARPVGGEPTQ